MTKLKTEAMSDLVGKKMEYIGDQGVLNLGVCMMFTDGKDLYVEQESTARRFLVREKKKGKGYTHQELKKQAYYGY